MNHLRKFLVSLILVSIVLFGYGQGKDSVIKNIRKLYKQINDDSTLKTVKLENDQFLPQMTDGGGSLTGFFKSEQLLKIHVWIGLSFGIRQFEYYFNKNGQLFFIYETEEDYPHYTTGALNYTKLNPAFEGRYYFEKGMEIQTINKGNRRFEPPSDFIKDVIANWKSYAILLKSRLKN